MKKHVAKFIALVAFLTWPAFVKAQSFDLGKVTVDELKATEHPVEKEAEAAYLFKHGITDFEFSQSAGFELKNTIKQKIKIYKKDGLSRGTIEIPFFKSDKTKERVNIVEANVYNLENGKVVRTKLPGSAQFEEKTNKYWSKLVLTFPNVKEGSIIELEYNLRSPFYTKIDPWYFQDEVPVDYSRYEFAAPEFYTFRPLQRGWGVISQTKRTDARRAQVVTAAERSSFAGNNGMSSGYLEYKSNRTIYDAKNIESFEAESYVNSMRDYLLAIDHVIEVIAIPGNPIRNVASTWDIVLKDVYEADSFTGEINKTGYFEKDLQAFLGTPESNAEKIAKTFEFVKNKMRWNDFVSFTSDGVKDAYKRGSGSVGDINLMLVAMLRSLGVECNPVLLSTRSNGRMIIPTHEAFNYVVAAARADGKWILLDASQQYGAPGVLPEHAINDFGYMLKSATEHLQISLNPTSISRSNYGVKYKIDSEGTVEGQAKITHTENAALRWRNNYGDFLNEKNIESVEKMFGGIEIGTIKVENLKDFTKPYEVNFDFKINDAVDIVGNQMYVKPMMFLASSQNYFEREKRTYPVEFSFPKAYRQNFSIEIPEGWEVEQLPANTNLATSPNFYTFRYVIQQQGNQIIVSVQEEIKESVVVPEDYETLRQFARQMLEKENEKIVLKRV